MNKHQTQPDAPTGNLKFGTKRDVAAMLGLCVRSIENQMAVGMPHLRLGKRRTRFDMAEVAEWAKAQYGTRRIGKENA